MKEIEQDVEKYLIEYLKRKLEGQNIDYTYIDIDLIGSGLVSIVGIHRADNFY